MERKFRVALSAFAFICAGLAGQGAWAGEEHHHHGHDAGGSQKLHLNAGKKWATDEPLRLAMGDINRAMAKALPLIHKNRFADADYQALAATIAQKVAYAVEHCKLGPQADEMLHVVIGDLIAGAEMMEGKTAASRHDGAVRTMQALKSYGRYFQHPGWR